MEEKKKQRRSRRTKADILEDINKAAREIVIKNGFSSSLVTDIIKKAKIEPSVFYNRYKDLDDFFSEFVKVCDYWFSDIAVKAGEEETSQKQFYTLLNGLLHSLKEKSVMLELLRWEVSEGNAVTRRTAQMREMFTLPLAKKYEKMFQGTGFDFVTIATLLISGVYYLSLHRDRATFCNIDLTTDEGVERVSKALSALSDMMFSLLEPQEQTLAIASRLRAKGVDEQTIRECLLLQ